MRVFAFAKQRVPVAQRLGFPKANGVFQESSNAAVNTAGKQRGRPFEPGNPRATGRRCWAKGCRSISLHDAGSALHRAFGLAPTLPRFQRRRRSRRPWSIARLSTGGSPSRPPIVFSLMHRQQFGCRLLLSLRASRPSTVCAAGQPLRSAPQRPY